MKVFNVKTYPKTFFFFLKPLLLFHPEILYIIDIHCHTLESYRYALHFTFTENIPR
jgi:hypothetical protein